MQTDDEAAAPAAQAQAAGATAQEWAWFRALSEQDCLPVVSDPTAEVHPVSKMKEVGKTPSRWHEGKVVGFPDWTQVQATKQQVDAWAREDTYGIAFQTRRFRAIDIDTEDQAEADSIQATVEAVLGPLQWRTRAGSPRRLTLVDVPGDLSKVVVKTKHGMVEFLATGQQAVVSGTHPKGQRYAWVGGLPVPPALEVPEFDALRELVALEHGVAAPVSARAALSVGARSAADVADPDVAWLEAKGWVTGWAADGKVYVRCPWESGHSMDSGITSTAYMPAGVGGQAQAGFKCLHASCAARGIFDFRRAIGLEQERILEEFPAATVVADASEVLPQMLVPIAPEFSDDSLALAFADNVGNELRFTPGLGWMARVGELWQRDDSLRRYDAARLLCRTAAAKTDKQAERKALASNKTVNAVIALAQSDRRLQVPLSAWDADPTALNTPGGIVDLRSATLRPRQGDLVTKCARITPDFGASCDLWLGFLDAVCAGDQQLVDFLQRLMGYLLTSDRREQKLFFIWGRGANGKSTLVELLLWILGDYGLKLASEALMESKHDRHPTELAQLKGVRAAISSELEEGQFFKEARVKELTGDDVLSARYMRGDFFSFPMTHKHLVVGNHKPRLRGGDPAMARRMVLIPFAAAFAGEKADPDMPAKLRAEAPAILAWMVRGAAAWYRGGLPLPPVVQHASVEYMADHDDVACWVEECCDRGVDAKARGGELYRHFAEWKLARGERAPSQVTWAERMALLPGVTRRRSGGTVYDGLQLRREASPAGVGADASEFA